MRISCGVPIHLAPAHLQEDIESLGMTIIETPRYIRVVYEGDNVHLVDSLLDIFEKVEGREITLDGYPHAQEKRRKRRKGGHL